MMRQIVGRVLVIAVIGLIGAGGSADPMGVRLAFGPRGDEAIRLEGMLHVPELEAGETVAGAVVCHPAPRMGGTADDVVVTAVAEELVARGIAVLRFNFRGVEESEGAFDGGKGEVRDVLGAVDALRAQEGIDPERIYAAGYSFGASMALLAALEDETIAAYAGVSLPFSGLDHEREQLGGATELTQPALVVIGDEDAYGNAEAIAGLLPEESAEVVVLAGVGHFYRAPGALEDAADAVAGFLEELGEEE